MASGAAAGAAVGAASAASAGSATALKAGGTLIELEPHRVVEFVSRYKDRGIVVVHGMKGIPTKKHVYVTALHGLIFYCSTSELLPVKVDIEAKTIFMRI